MSHPLEECYRTLDRGGSVLDVGCFGFRQVAVARSLGLLDLRHHGVDYCEPEGPAPAEFVFRRADLRQDPIPFEDDRFDLVVASHVLEHLPNPLELFAELARVCRPGGLIYVESPSWMTVLFPGMPFDHDRFFSLSFFDDPTHASRPWTRQALHRLARYYSLEVVSTGKIKGPIRNRLALPYLLAKAWWKKDGETLESAARQFGWSVHLTARKPSDLRGKPAFRYYIPPR